MSAPDYVYIAVVLLLGIFFSDISNETRESAIKKHITKTCHPSQPSEVESK